MGKVRNITSYLDCLTHPIVTPTMSISLLRPSEKSGSKISHLTTANVENSNLLLLLFILYSSSGRSFCTIPKTFSPTYELCRHYDTIFFFFY